MSRADRNQKLVISVVQRQDAEKLLQTLVKEGYGSTVLSSTGGFLRRGNATILTLCSSRAVDAVIGVVENATTARKQVHDASVSLRAGEGGTGVPTGGASVWVLDAELAGTVPARARSRED